MAHAYHPVESWVRRLRSALILREVLPASVDDHLYIPLEQRELSELPALGAAALRAGDPLLAYSAFDRLQQALGSQTPSALYGLLAQALHQLGRFAEATDMVNRGLGPHAALVTPPPVADEQSLLARWGGQETPVVSILCTAYNHERYIEQALHGFLGQDTGFRFEVLIHDDASTDRTADILREWQSRYPSIIRTTLQRENQFRRGVRPMELLLASARGRYIATCEGDDYWIAPSKLERQVAFLEAHADFSCVAHNYYHLVELNPAVRPWIATREERVFTPRQLMAMRRLFWAPTLVFRKLFDRVPRERALAALGDQFFTAYLGSFGAGMYFEDLIGTVRRENPFSTWSPLNDVAKERQRVQTWMAIVYLHTAAGRSQSAADMLAKIAASPLHPDLKQQIADECERKYTNLLAA